MLPVVRRFGAIGRRFVTTEVYDPPAAPPSPLNTPTIFIPQERQSDETSTETVASGPLPPPLKRIKEKKYHLSEEDVEEIRTLRRQDPDKWNRKSLSKKFGCSQFFIGMIAEAPEKRQKELEKLENIKARWSKNRVETRRIREVNKRTWGLYDRT